jgi:ADP-ribose pyrophosphatase
VPDQLVAWGIPFPDYQPAVYDRPRALTPKAKPGDYADPANPRLVRWDRRQSFSTAILLNTDGYPLNPSGRTGIGGGSRGKLNAWGPTLAADPIITRQNTDTGAIELLVVTRTDNGRCALPGEKIAVNPSNEIIESPLAAAQRGLWEEAGIKLDLTEAVLKYSGYVDDERNTDNAWMETQAFYLHLPPVVADTLVLSAREPDVSRPEWAEVNDELLASLNANQGDIVHNALH